MIKDIFKMGKEGKMNTTYYLIDFENVGSDGLKGCDQLKKNDQIHLFYTNNANKISLDVFSSRGEAALYVHKVPVKSQSLDMHLVSYLGYLIGSNDENCSYVIISKDTDFDNIIKFWQEERDAVISRAGRIVPDKKAEKKAEKSEKKPEKKPKKKLTDILTKKSEAKPETENEPQTAPAEETEAKTAPTETEQQAAPDAPAPKKKKKKKKKAKPKEVSTPDENTERSNQMEQALAAAGKSSEVIAYVTSVAVRHAGKDNARQTVYRTMVAEYGQEQGRDIYNRIRKYI
jgi:chemotaxis protein histidine kinase CheA